MSLAGTDRPRALIVGGSLAGLSAAVWLGHSGLRVEVLERARGPLQGFGAGIVLHPSTSRFLVHERVSLDEISLGVRHLRYIGPAGEVTAELPSRLRFSSYGTLHRYLLGAARRGGVRYRTAAAVAAVGSSSDGAWAELAAGGRRHGDIVVGADGIHSTVRRQLFPGVVPELAGYVAWRGVLDEAMLEPAAAAPLSGAITYCILDHSHLLTYPIASESGQRVLRNWVWYRNVASQQHLDALRRDRHGVLRELSVPAGAVSPKAVTRLRSDATRELPWPVAALVRDTPRPFLQVVADTEPSSLVSGRVCVLGDAGFAARPHAAAGTAKAAEEARLLAEALRSCRDAGQAHGRSAGDAGEVRERSWDPGEALAAWEAQALSLGQSLVARSRAAGDRAQRQGTWQPGEPLPFGLRAAGDSEAW